MAFMVQQGSRHGCIIEVDGLLHFHSIHMHLSVHTRDFIAKQVILHASSVDEVVRAQGQLHGTEPLSHTYSLSVYTGPNTRASFVIVHPLPPVTSTGQDYKSVTQCNFTRITSIQISVYPSPRAIAQQSKV